jgi:flagellar assembly factor FliW
MTEPLPELVFESPMPGLDGLSRFALVRLDDVGALFRLQSLEDASVRLVVAAPWLCAPEYTPQLDDDICARLDLRSDADAVLLLVVSPGDTLAESTVNLLAPIVVNAGTGRAAQVVLTDSEHALRSPLVSA